VKDGKYTHVRDDIVPFVYTPYAQDNRMGTARFYVRTSQRPESIAATLRETVQHLDASLTVYGVKTGEEQVDSDLIGERLTSKLSAGFGILAALLGCVGIYGVLAFIVVQRTREIGIRIALGAMQADIGRMVLREVVVLLAAGVVVGLPAAYGLGRLLESILYGVHAGNMAALVAGPALMGVVALAAAYLPARRATRIDPMVALRYE